MANQKISALTPVVTPVGTDRIPVTQAANINISSSYETLAQVQTFTLTSGAVTNYLHFPNTGLKIFDTNATNYLSIVPGSNLTADRNLNIITGDSNRDITFGGDLAFADDFTTVGNFPVTQTYTGTTTVTFPTSGTLATTANLGSYLPLAGGTMSGDIILGNGVALKTNSTSGNTAIIQAYDNDLGAYRTFGTLTNGNAPSFGLLNPAPGGASLFARGLTGLSIIDGSAHEMFFANISTTTSDHNLFFNTNDGDATINITGSVKMNQNVDTTASVTFAGLTSVLISATGQLRVDGTLETYTVLGSEYQFTAYSTDAAAQVGFLLASRNAVATFAFSQPVHGLLTWDGGAIGSVTPAAGTFTALTANTSLKVKGGGAYYMGIANNDTLTADRTLTVILNDANRTLTIGADSSINQNVSTAGSPTFTAVDTSSANTWSKAQRGIISALTDGATITPDFSLANNYSVVLGGNRTLGVPTNLVAGQCGNIQVRQDITGSRTLAYAWVWIFPSGTAPVLSTGKLSFDQLYYFVNSYSTATVTVTIAAPAVMTWTAHGLISGQRIQLTTTGALPTGLAVSTTYWVTVVDANTFKLSTSLANAQAATFITTTGSQSGTHTATQASITLSSNLGLA